ncbi:hypothetical protein I4U23_024326 [Adineta vaga]|nr:hypothetical protein I4U23_024326 [Adineta vaga]
MKLYFFLFVVLIVLVQTFSSYAEQSDSSSENENLDRVLNKRLSSQWGKRLQKVWGKRSESDNTELYQHILRELYHNARLRQLEHPLHSDDNDRSESFNS